MKKKKVKRIIKNVKGEQATDKWAEENAALQEALQEKVFNENYFLIPKDKVNVAEEVIITDDLNNDEEMVYYVINRKDLHGYELI